MAAETNSNAPTRATAPLTTRRRPRTALVVLLAVAAALLFTAAAGAYVVVLKDGTQIITAQKYEVDGETVILTMRNGNTNSYAAADVDFEATHELNVDNRAGQSTFIEEKILEIDRSDEPVELDSSLSDVVTGRGLSLPEPSKREAATSGSGPQLPMTSAGYVDLMRVEREPLADSEVTSEVETYLEGQGNKVSLFEGVSEGLPILEVRANTESEVFKGIRDTASALVQLMQRFPDRVRGLDVLFLTEKDIRGGQFSMTPEQAQLISSGRLEPQVYFLRYVEF